MQQHKLGHISVPSKCQAQQCLSHLSDHSTPKTAERNPGSVLIYSVFDNGSCWFLPKSLRFPPGEREIRETLRLLGLIN